MRKFCVTISTLKLCQRWGFRKTRACLLGVAGMGCEMQDRLLNSPSVIISSIMTSNQGCSVHASSPIVANSCFVHGDDYVGLGVRGDLEGYKAKLFERFIIKDRGILGTNFEKSHHVSSSETRVSRDVDVRSGSETR